LGGSRFENSLGKILKRFHHNQQARHSGICMNLSFVGFTSRRFMFQPWAGKNSEIPSKMPKAKKSLGI
jgi:hypothetical protein